MQELLTCGEMLVYNILLKDKDHKYKLTSLKNNIFIL